MEEDKRFLLKGAMSYGFAMGLYWVFKYLFFVLGFSYAFLNVFYWSFTLLVPVIAYRMTLRYQTLVGKPVGFFHAWQFGVMLYFFAAIVVSLAHYVFYRYLAPPDLLTNTIHEMEAMLRREGAGADVLSAVKDLRVTPIQMAIQGIFNNVLYGILFSIPVAFLVSRGKARNGEMNKSGI